MKQKRAVSPVVATVLLIMIVIILAIIILLWARGFIKEAITKQVGEKEKTVQQYCQEISLKSIIQKDGCFGFQNTGTIPIYQYKLKLDKKDSGETTTETGGGVSPGISVIVKDSSGNCFIYDNYESVKVKPVLLGNKKSGGTESFECSNEFPI